MDLPFNYTSRLRRKMPGSGSSQAKAEEQKGWMHPRATSALPFRAPHARQAKPWAASMERRAVSESLDGDASLQLADWAANNASKGKKMRS
jgi:hypothetical protein